jgi:hypothetical protein
MDIVFTRFKPTSLSDVSLFVNARRLRNSVIPKGSILQVLFTGCACEVYSTMRGECEHIILVFCDGLVAKSALFFVFPIIYSYSVCNKVIILRS